MIPGMIFELFNGTCFDGRMQNFQLDIDLQAIAPLMNDFRQSTEQERRIFLGVVSTNHADQTQKITAQTEIQQMVFPDPFVGDTQNILGTLMDTDQTDQ